MPISGCRGHLRAVKVTDWENCFRRARVAGFCWRVQSEVGTLAYEDGEVQGSDISGLTQGRNQAGGRDGNGPALNDQKAGGFNEY